MREYIISFKDLLENQKIEIVDEDTILEISTFVAKGQSYEASQGNHDDLVMNFIMFSYFSGTIFFNEITVTTTSFSVVTPFKPGAPLSGLCKDEHPVFNFDVQ